MSALGGQYFTPAGPIALGQRIGKGGEGEVFLLTGQNGAAVKLYNPALRASREKKIERLVSMNLGQTIPFAAFPLAVVRDASGKFAGFTMNAIKDHVPIFEVFGPGSRKRVLPAWDYRHLVRAARNLSQAVGAIHQAGCVIGDINSNGILVGKDATVALIDADSFQIATNDSAMMCHVGVPEYTPPELQGQALTSLARNPQNDCFGLAAIIFQLLFIGRHPFQGTHEKKERSLDEAIKESMFVYSRTRDTGMLRPPTMHMVDTFPDEIFNLFDRAFAPGANGSRPRPEEWGQAMSLLEVKLEKCSRSQTHYALGAATDCVWCALERDHLFDLFPASLADLEKMLGQFGGPTDYGEFDRLWKQVASIPDARLLEIEPATISTKIEPSLAARAADGLLARYNLWSALALVASISAFFVLPSLWILWGVAAFASFRALKRNSTPSGSFTAAYVKAHGEYQETLRRWREHIGLMRLVALKTEAWELEDKIRGSEARLKETLEQFATDAEARHRAAFLSGFYIRSAKIDKITSANVAALISYGIETAADIDLWRVQAVSGIGPVKAEALVKWRDWKARGIPRQMVSSADDERVKAKLRYDHVVETRRLASIATTKCRQILQLHAAIQAASQSKNELVSAARLRVDQARLDLEHLKLPVPSLASVKVDPPKRPLPKKPKQTTQSPGHAKSQNNSAQGRGASTPPLPPDCPQCGTSMILKTARRGRGAGRQFWSCARFPRCRGSRNY